MEPVCHAARNAITCSAFWCGSVATSKCSAGFLIGLYYGGTGIGIALSALLVPMAISAAEVRGSAHGWQWAWLGLGALCLLATLAMALPTKQMHEAPAGQRRTQHFELKAFAGGLSGYFMFGVGYIGYMTFVVALLKQQDMQPAAITAFYALLGAAVVASSRIWAGMLDRFKGGESMAILNGLLGTATILPALTASVPLVFISGIVFGAVFFVRRGIDDRHGAAQSSFGILVGGY